MAKFYIGYTNSNGKLETYLCEADSLSKAFDMASLQHGGNLLWVRNAI
jgi:hypothetical protein